MRNIKFILVLFLCFFTNISFGEKTNKEIIKPGNISNTENTIVESFDMKDVDVLTLTKNISKLTGKKFIISDDKIKKQKVTIVSPTSITVQDAYNAFLTVLDANGYAVLESGPFLKIVEKKDTPGGVALHKGTYYPKNDQYITRVIKLKYINASDIEEELSGSRKNSFLGNNLKIKALEDTNTLLVTGTGNEISSLEKIISLLDIKGYNFQLAVIPIKNADASKMKEIIENLIFQSEDSGSTSTTRKIGFSRLLKKSSPASSKSSYGKGSERYSKIFSDDRTNSIIVLANKDGINNVKNLVKKLDFRVVGGSNIHVYNLQNAKAENVSKTLNNLIQGSKLKKDTDNLFSEVKVTYDEGVNAIVVSAKPKDYQSIKEIIDKLDVRKGQVLFETVTVELTIDEDSSLGVSSNYAMSPEVPRAVGFDPSISSSNTMMNYLTDPSALSGMILGFGSKEVIDVNLGGETLSVPRLSAFITALEKNSKANVLQRPSIITSDNEEATIKVMDKIPVVKGTVLNQVGSQQNIEEVEVGLLLKITPMINQDAEFIKLNIDQETSNLTDKAPRDLSATTVSTNSREIKTSVLVRDGDTVVIGGLYKDDVSTTQNKVPFLGDIPLIGWLFRGKTERSTKTNLLVFITPHVVKNYETHQQLTLDALEGRKGFIKNFEKKDKFKGILESIENKNKNQIKKAKESKKDTYLPESGIKFLPLQ
jgi:general secretion pathway protein D